MPARIGISDEDFVALWNSSPSTRFVCDRLGITQKQALAKSSRMRLAGFDLKRRIKQHERLDGFYKTRIYRIWIGILRRCRNPNCTDYERYGGSGISVCHEWSVSFSAFREWSMENGYSEDLTLDRRDGNLGYSPENCRWATVLEQARNARKQTRKTSSKYKGVSWSADKKKWVLQVVNSGKPSYRGSFTDEIEAAREYDRIVKEEFGEFACLNFKEKES